MRRNPFSERNSEDIVADLTRDAVTRALRMPAGVERDRLLRTAGHDDIQVNITAWAYSSGLQRPV